MIFQKISNNKNVKIPTIYIAVGMFVFIILYIIFLSPYLSIRIGKHYFLIITLGLAVIPFIFSFVFKYSIINTFSMRKVKAKNIFAGCILAGGMFFMVFYLSGIMSIFFPDMQGTSVSFLRYIRNENIFLVVLGIAVLPALCEEFLYRGFILSGLKSSLGKCSSIFLCALLFGLMHLDPYQIPLTFGVGIGLSWIAWETKSILIPIGMHFLHNCSLLVILRYTDSKNNSGLNFKNLYVSISKTLENSIALLVSVIIIQVVFVGTSIIFIYWGIKIIKTNMSGIKRC